MNEKISVEGLIDILEKYKNIDKLTFELVHELIDKVYVGALNLETKEREIDIHWKF